MRIMAVTGREDISMIEQDTDLPASTTLWSVEWDKRFWSKPDPKNAMEVLHPEVVSYWPGLNAPVIGPVNYVGCLAALVQMLPDVRLVIPEHAYAENLYFVSWIMLATGKNGFFELEGVDRIRLCDGLLIENLVIFDTAAFATRSGIDKPPWSS